MAKYRRNDVKNMRAKANFNKYAAQMIINARDEDWCFVSVHCSYYSVLQMMKYLLAHVKQNPISYEEQELHSANGSSHENILLEILKRMGQNRQIERTFLQTFNFLRNQRKAADYTSKLFKVEDCADIKQKADGLLSNLESYFRDKIN
jgi:hypothetical protein